MENKNACAVSKVFENFIRNAVATAAEGTFRISQKAVGKDEVEHLYQVSWNPKVKVHRLGKNRLCVALFENVAIHFLKF